MLQHHYTLSFNANFLRNEYTLKRNLLNLDQGYDTQYPFVFQTPFFWKKQNKKDVLLKS